MKYICNTCNYTTENKGNYYKHNKTKKHLEKSNKSAKSTKNDPKTIPEQSRNNPGNISIDKKIISEKQKKYLCDYCNTSFTQSCHLSRHLKYCKKKESEHKLLEQEFQKYKEQQEFEKYKIEKDNEIYILKEKLNFFEKEKKYIENEKMELKQHLETLKNENKFQKHLIESAGGMIKKSMNTFSYLLLNYNNAPELQSLKDYSIISKNREALIENLIYYHKKGNFEKYIGDFLIQQYKKDDPKMQAFWSSDIERLNYFIRELINNNTEGCHINKEDLGKKENKSISWLIDKKGIRVRKNIIDPLLQYVHDIGVKYLNEKNKEIYNLDNNKAIELVSKMQEIGAINSGIKSNIISNNINKYIAPHFYLNKE